MTTFGPGRGEKERWEGFWWDTYGDLGRNHGIMTNQTIIYNDAEGNHSSTLRMIFYFDDQGDLIQTTEEYVDSDGNGTRTVRTFEDGRRTGSSVRSFHATLDSDGNYDSYATDPASPVPDPDTSEESDVPPGESPPVPPSDGPGDPYPGPDGDDTTLADFCERRENATSGVEQAADTDPTAFRVGCGDLVGAPAGGDDCTIIDWAGPRDFAGALQPSGDDDGCDPFFVRGQGGDCEPSTALETLRGRTAMIASANLRGLVICPPIVCDPPPVSVEARQEISSNDVTPVEVITVTPSPLSPPTLTTDALCWKGPGSRYEVINSVQAGTQVMLLGRGLEGDWWVIDSSRYPGVACWLPGDALDVDPDLVLADLPLFKAPPIPTPTPTPILGCLYKGPNDNQAVCYPIGQCPVPFDQSQGACSP